MDALDATNGAQRLVVIESPYAGEVEANVAYARTCMADAIKRGEFPLASHLLYTQPGILDDNVPEERKLGMTAGLVWGAKAASVVIFYLDRGISEGMRQAAQFYDTVGVPMDARWMMGAPPQDSEEWIAAARLVGSFL